MPFDRHTDTWRVTAAALDIALSESRDAIATPGYDPIKTEFHRGRIQLAIELLALPDRNPPDDQARKALS